MKALKDILEEEKLFAFYTENLHSLTKKQLIEFAEMQQFRLQALDEYVIQNEIINAFTELQTAGAVVH